MVDFAKEVLIKYAENNDWIECFKYVEKVFPKEIWAKTTNELRDPQSSINVYQDYLSENATLDIPIQQQQAFIILKASISTYNSLLLANLADFNNPQHMNIASKVQAETLQHLMDSSLSNS